MKLKPPRSVIMPTFAEKKVIHKMGPDESTSRGKELMKSINPPSDLM
jgi:hypothetical protein